MSNEHDGLHLLSEDAARRLIQRALQLQDRESAGLRVEHVRHALGELGVSDRVFYAALRDTTILQEAGAARSSPTAWHAATVGIGLGAATTTLIAVFPDIVDIIPLSMLSMAMVSGALAMKSGAGVKRAQLANASLWVGFSGAAAVLTTWAHAHGASYGFVWEWQPLAMMWSLTSVAGLLATFVRSTHGSGSTPKGSMLTRLRAAVANGLRWMSQKIEPHLRGVMTVPR